MCQHGIVPIENIFVNFEQGWYATKDNIYVIF